MSLQQGKLFILVVLFLLEQGCSGSSAGKSSDSPSESSNSSGAETVSCLEKYGLEKIHFVYQGQSSWGNMELDAVCGENSIVSLSPSFFLGNNAPDGGDELTQYFLSRTQQDFVNQMQSWITYWNNIGITHHLADPNFDGTLMPDFESDLHFAALWHFLIDSPNHPGWYNPALLQAICEKYVDVLKAIHIVYPNAKRTLYSLGGVGTGDGQIISTVIPSYQVARDAGVFDQMDFLTAADYPGYSSADGVVKFNLAQVCMNSMYTIAEQVNAILPQPKPIFPLLTFTIYNPNSINQWHCITYEDMKVFVELTKSRGFTTIGFWNNGQTLVSLDCPTLTTVEYIAEFLPSIEQAVGCPGDLNQDNAVDGNDLGILLGDLGNSGIRLLSDLNEDGIVDDLDKEILISHWGACQE